MSYNSCCVIFHQMELNYYLGWGSVTILILNHCQLKSFSLSSTQTGLDDDFEEEEMSSSNHDKKDTHIY